MHPTASSTVLPAVPPDDTAERFGRPERGWRLALYRVIFESDTRVGRAFDVALLWLIVASVVVVVLDSVESIGGRAGRVFDLLEWGCTIVFTLEYLARLACVRRPWRYAASLLGAIDLLALLPTWLALFAPELPALIDLRVLRLLRIFFHHHKAKLLVPPACEAAGLSRAAPQAGEFQRTVSRLVEMRTRDYLGAQHRAEQGAASGPD